LLTFNVIKIFGFPFFIANITEKIHVRAFIFFCHFVTNVAYVAFVAFVAYFETNERAKMTEE